MFSSATPKAKFDVPQDTHAWFSLYFDTLDCNVVSKIKVVLKILIYLL